MTESEKTRTLFWLRRMLRERETTVQSPSHENMAAAGISYGERAEREKAIERLKEKLGPEIEALTLAIRQVEATPVTAAA